MIFTLLSVSFKTEVILCFFISKQHSNVFILEHPMFILNYITQNMFDRQNTITTTEYCNDLLFSTSKMVFRCSPSFCLPQPVYATCVMSISFPWSFNVPCPIESTISPECMYFPCSDFSFLISNVLLWARYLLSSVTCHPPRITSSILVLVNNFFLLSRAVCIINLKNTSFCNKHLP